MAAGKLKNKFTKKKISNYQDLVIKDGKFVGKFEEMYSKFSDPWNYISIGENNIDHKIIIEFCEHIAKTEKKTLTVLEMGCGFGFLSYALAKKGFKTYGFDISKTAIRKGKKKFKNKNLKMFVSEFDNFELFNKIKPDIFILSDISWYVLPKLKKFITYFKKTKPAYIVHCLAIPAKQNYGNKFFTSEKSIIKFFNLDIIASSNIKFFSETNKNKILETHTYFLAKN